MRGAAKRFRLLCVCFAILSVAPSLAQADVFRDGTIGSAGAGSVQIGSGPSGGADYLIQESDGLLIGGRNLFHSFLRFDLLEGERAVYQGSSSIENLITRVTGGPSFIDGTIRSEIAGANLFFINPAGVIFGENAELDVTGNFVVTTAQRLLFEGGDIFDATSPTTPLVSVENVDGFGFLEAPAPIQILGSRIEGAVDRAIGIVGGDIEIRGRGMAGAGRLAARSGRIDLASLASAGEVRLDADVDNDGHRDGLIATTGVTERANITIRENTLITTSGLPVNPLNVLDAEEGSGPINFFANDVLLEDAILSTLTVTSEDGGTLTADLSGDFIGRSRLGTGPTGITTGTGFSVSPQPGQFVDGIFNRTFPTYFVEVQGCGGFACGARYISSGAAGDISIQAQNLLLEDGARFTTRSDAIGSAGEIRLAIEDSIRFRGVDSAGERSGLSSTAESTGDPGRIRIDSPNAELVLEDFGTIVIQNSRTSIASSAPGLIEIDVASIEMTGNARIDSSTRGNGPGGNIDITARDAIRLSGQLNDEEFTGITTLAQPGSTGDAGSIRIETPILELDDGAQIAARPIGTGATGDAGSLEFDIADRLSVRRSTITTESAVAAGGNIAAFVGNQAELLEGSEISTTVTSGSESGGNIEIRGGAESVVIVDASSRVVARADEGAGGNILIESSLFLPDADSVISAASNLGIDGRVVTRAPDGELIDLNQSLETGEIDARALLDEPCAARVPGGSSSLVVADRRGRPLQADGFLPAFLPASVFEASDESATGSSGSASFLAGEDTLQDRRAATPTPPWSGADACGG